MLFNEAFAIQKSGEPEQSHEVQPAAMAEWQIERVAAAFTDVGVGYGEALNRIFKADPASYAAYRERNFR